MSRPDVQRSHNTLLLMATNQAKKKKKEKKTRLSSCFIRKRGSYRNSLGGKYSTFSTILF